LIEGIDENDKVLKHFFTICNKNNLNAKFFLNGTAGEALDILKDISKKYKMLQPNKQEEMLNALEKSVKMNSLRNMRY
jgi:hypothetical protein